MGHVGYDAGLARRHREAQPFRKQLEKARNLLTPQDAKTLLGQALHGDIEDAERGLAKLIRRHYGDE